MIYIIQKTHSDTSPAYLLIFTGEEIHVSVRSIGSIGKGGKEGKFIKLFS